MSNTISLWASQNKKSARTLLVINHLCLGFIAYGVGLILSDSIDVAWWQIVTLYTVSFLFYKKNKQPKSKGTLTAHLVILFFNFCFWTMIGVKEAHWAEKNVVSNTKSVSYAKFAVYNLSVEQAVPSIENTKATDNTFFSMWKKNILRDKAFVKKHFKPDPNSDISGRIILNILLMLLGTTAILFLGFMAACSLTCSGYNFGAVAVIALGIFLLIMLWRFGQKKSKALFAELRKLEAEDKLRNRKKAKEEKAMPKTDVPPTVVVPVPPPKKKEKKLSKAEQERLGKVDNGVLLVKIITIAVLAILIITMIATSIFI